MINISNNPNHPPLYLFLERDFSELPEGYYIMDREKCDIELVDVLATYHMFFYEIKSHIAERVKGYIPLKGMYLGLSKDFDGGSKYKEYALEIE